MRKTSAVLATMLALLTGCATKVQAPLPLAVAALQASEGRVGVVMTALPKVDTEFPGAACLLCLAVASASNSSLTAHTRTLPLEDLPQLKKLAAEAINKRGGQAVVIDDELKLDDLPNFSPPADNMALKDHRGLAQKYKVDRLVVINLNAVGIWRNYASYVPSGEPRAVVKGLGYLVNLRTNGYEWYAPVDLSRGATQWDQPPNFPDLSNAYFQVLEMSKDQLIKPLR